MRNANTNAQVLVAKKAHSLYTRRFTVQKPAQSLSALGVVMVTRWDWRLDLRECEMRKRKCSWPKRPTRTYTYGSPCGRGEA